MVAPFGGSGFNTAATGSMTDYQRYLRRRQAEMVAGTLGTTDPAPANGFSLAQSAPEALGSKMVQPFIQPGLWGAQAQAGPAMQSMSVQEAAPPPATPSIPPPVPTLAGGPPPTTPSGLTNGNPNNNGVATAPPQAGDYGAYKYGAANPNMNRFRFGFAAPGASDNFGSYLYAVGYNPQQDTYQHAFDVGGEGRGHTENNWNRIYGWANQFAQANGYGDIKDMSPDAWQKAANYAIGRLRTDLLSEDPSGQRWQQSGFAGSDKYLAPGAYGAGAGGAGGAGGGGAGVGGGAGGAVDASGLTYATRSALVRDPKAAVRQLLQQQGLNPDSGGWAAKFLQDNYTNAVSALTQMAGHTNGPGGIAENEIMGLLGGLQNSLFSRGGDAASYLRDIASRSLGNAAGELGQMGDASSMPFYENANYLAGFGGSAAAQNARQNRLNRWENQYGDAAIYGTLGGDASVPQTFAEFMKRRGYDINSPFR